MTFLKRKKHASLKFYTDFQPSFSAKKTLKNIKTTWT